MKITQILVQRSVVVPLMMLQNVMMVIILMEMVALPNVKLKKVMFARNRTHKVQFRCLMCVFQFVVMAFLLLLKIVMMVILQMAMDAIMLATLSLVTLVLVFLPNKICKFLFAKDFVGMVLDSLQRNVMMEIQLIQMGALMIARLKRNLDVSKLQILALRFVCHVPQALVQNVIYIQIPTLN